MPANDIVVSMVIDDVHDHSYKADLLIRTLARNAGIPPARVIVQHVDRVPAGVVESFARMGCKMRQIAPFLDGRYCNKLQQLGGLELQTYGAAGILLLDLDIAVAAPLSLPDRSRLCGKIVDAPNPPLPVLAGLFAAAKVVPPETVACDWDSGETFATNFNGGVLYFPADLVAVVGHAWRDFARFLSAKGELFENEQQMNHIDQIALALAIASTGAPYSHLAANSNFPTHSGVVPRTYDRAKPVEALHYHWELDDFGFIAATSRVPAVAAAASAVNAVAVTSTDIDFYRRFKHGRAAGRSPLSDLPPEHPLVRELTAWLGTARQAPTLAFHAGTPKTGTKSLQFFLEENRADLAQRGIWYPETRDAREPKQQYLIGQLIGDDAQGFAESILSALRTMPDGTKTVLFSTEGLFNHWWDFPPQARAMLRFLASRLPVEFLVSFRDPVDFAAALYLQYTRNPPVHPCYGRDWSIETMLDDAWFKRHLDYMGFVLEVEHTLGEDALLVFDYSPDVVTDLLRHAGAGDLPGPEFRRNVSNGQQGLAMLRVINQCRLEPRVREQIISHISQIESLLEAQRQPFVPIAETREAIRRLTQKNSALLQRRTEACA
jgi:hypothetical protein